MFDNQHAAMGVVADAVGGVAEQPAPHFRIVAVAHYNQVAAGFAGQFDNGLGRMSAAGFARDVQIEFCGQLLDFLLALFKVIIRRLVFLLELARQIRVAWQRFAHPEGRDLRVSFFGEHGGATQSDDWFEQTVSAGKPADVRLPQGVPFAIGR